MTQRSSFNFFPRFRNPDRNFQAQQSMLLLTLQLPKESGPGSTPQSRFDLDPFIHSLLCFLSLSPQYFFHILPMLPPLPKSYHNLVFLGLMRCPHCSSGVWSLFYKTVNLILLVYKTCWFIAGGIHQMG